MPLRTLTATRYVTPLREGGSLPAIVEANDQGLCVMKFRGAAQGANALVAEVPAGEIARAAGLAVPELVLLDLGTIRAHLASIPRICAGGEAAGPIGRLSPRERFRWLTAPRSAVIQSSPAHTGRCDDPAALLLHLLDTMVRTPRAQ